MTVVLFNVTGLMETPVLLDPASSMWGKQPILALLARAMYFVVLCERNTAPSMATTTVC